MDALNGLEVFFFFGELENTLNGLEVAPKFQNLLILIGNDLLYTTL